MKAPEGVLHSRIYVGTISPESMEWRLETGPKVWADVMERVDRGEHPRAHQLAFYVALFGVPTYSSAAEYVAARISKAGRAFPFGDMRVKPGARKGPRKLRPPDSELWSLYQAALADEQVKHKTMGLKAYRRTFGPALAPADNARRLVADATDVSVNYLKKLRAPPS